MSLSPLSVTGSESALSLSPISAITELPKLCIDLSEIFSPFAVGAVPIEFDPDDLTNGDSIYILMDKILNKNLTYVIAIIRESIAGKIFYHNLDADFLERYRVKKDENPLTAQKINEVSYFIINKGEKVFRHLLSINFSQIDASKYTFIKTYIKANQGDAEFQLSTGRLFESGKGIQKSVQEALRYYQLAAEQDFPEAAELAAKLKESEAARLAAKLKESESARLAAKLSEVSDSGKAKSSKSLLTAALKLLRISKQPTIDTEERKES